MSDYFVGHGIVYAAQRDGSGNPEGFVDLGNATEFVIHPGTRGIRNVDNTSVLGKMLPPGNIGTLQITIDELNAYNLAQAFYGHVKSQNGASIVGESVNVYTGKFCPVAHINISNVAVAGKVEGTDYTVEPSGGLHVIDGTGSPWSVSYDYTTHNIMAAFSQAPELLCVRLNGINIAEDSKKVIVDVYKVRFTPVGNVPLFGDAFTSLSLSGKILYDETKADNDILGRYFRIRSV